MTVAVRIVDLWDDEPVMRRLAGWMLDEWSHMFPEDTVGWYLDLWRSAARTHEGPPHAVVALDGDTIVGTASVVPDDGLPDATEPGPWLALTYVLPGHRGKGTGTRMVRELMSRCPDGLWLYTESGNDWYGSLGWDTVRQSAVNGVPVTVMQWQARD